MTLGKRVQHAVLDVADTSAVERLLAEVRPDVVVHAAWAGLTRAERDGPDQLTQLHAWCRFAQAAGAAGVRKLVGIGSQAEYGATTGRTDERHLPDPTSMYGAAKLSAGMIGRRLAADAGMEFAWLRLFAVYGPGDNPNWLIPSLISTFRQGERPRLTPGTQRVDYLYVQDAAEGVLAVVEGSATGTFNLSSGSAVTVRAIVERLRRPGRAGDAARVRRRTVRARPADAHRRRERPVACRDRLGADDGAGGGFGVDDCCLLLTPGSCHAGGSRRKRSCKLDRFASFGLFPLARHAISAAPSTFQVSVRGIIESTRPR